MYLPGFDVLARSAAPQQQQPKLQTAFVSNTSSTYWNSRSSQHL
ncbi:hypothetical protein HanXRQr2_Chr13g0618261 [Helianthus annuus]|uniref:Uncharacterized protein n=1 Tax=Helianthus annuus TaxID=4232 RepID=A0A9K3HE80_HELAN|nr:hypothetical protein HanXRQr2_Chr13g0618261 [Helianthus annuus]